MNQLYRPLDEWASSLSRTRSAVLQGALAAVVALIVGMILQGEWSTAKAVGIGLGIAGFSYWSNPEDKN